MKREYQRTLKSGMGGGTSSPETRMWNFSRILSFSSSVRSRMYVGARQLYHQCRSAIGRRVWSEGR